MTTQELIGAFCEHYGVTREALRGVYSRRHELLNEEFAEWFRGGGRTAADDGALRGFYAASKWMPYGMLCCAVGEMSSGQTGWVQRQIEAANPTSVLDYGCGLAVAAGPFAEQGVAVTLADVRGQHVEFLRALYPAARIVALEELERGTFDVVVCQEVFEHCADPVAALWECLDRVAAAGSFICSYNFGGSAGNHLHLAANAAWGHEDAFAGEIGKAGFEVATDRDGQLRVWRRRA